MENEIRIPGLDRATMAAFQAKTAAHPQTPAAVAEILLYVFAHHAPDGVATDIAGYCGTPGNFFATLELRTRSKVKAELADELLLCEVIRKIAAPRRTS